MGFLVDPARVSLGPIGWSFLAFMCVVLPFLALRQHRAMATLPAMPSRTRLYASALFTHATLLVMVYAVVSTEGPPLVGPYQPTLTHVLIGVVALGAGLLLLLERFQFENPVGRERTKALVPRTPGEHALYYVVCVSAGIAEEITYRGLLFTLLTGLFGGWWVPALVASAAFGIVHLFQGWKSATIAGLMGLRDHVVVGLTGTLFVAMILHVLHDIVTGTTIARRVARAEREGAHAIS